MTGRMTDEQYREWERAWPAKEAARHEAGRIHNAEVRKAAPVVELTLEAVLGKLGWTKEYAEHSVQPYCDCWSEGWYECAHSRDLGLPAWQP